MESSNTSELVSDSTNTEAASAVEQSQPVESQGAAETVEATEHEGKGDKSFIEKVKERAAASKASETDGATKNPQKVAETPATPNSVVENKPAYEPNYKYKAFGKEKELDEAFRPLLKDPESEKKVKDVFTRADAFDDMKQRYEATSYEQQKLLQEHKGLESDVRRITGFLNKGDLDNFFSSVRLSDDQILKYLQHKAEIANLSPMQQQQYADATQMRAQQFQQQEMMNQMQANYANQAVLNRTMQLDYAMQSPQISQAADAFDAKMGHGAFRQLVIDTGAQHYNQTRQDLSPAEITQMVMTKWGKLLEQPQVQSVVPQAAQTQVAPQVQPVVNAKPVIPVVAGRGATPISQKPKSLDDLKRMAKEAAARENSQGFE